MKRLFALSMVALALILGANAAAQESFPSKSVRLVVPAAPGGGFDVFARIIGKRLSDRWGQQVIIDNRAGGSGNIAAANVVSSKPDGYTLFVWNDTLLINPSLLTSVPYDPQRDFTPISLCLYVPNILVAHPPTKFRSFKEFWSQAQKNPGSLSYGSPGNGSPAHLGTELMKQLAKIDIRHIPYKGAGPAITDVLGGQIPLAMIAVPGAIEYVRSGKLLALAVTSDKRIEALPQVPTMKESGLSDYRIDTFFAVLGPAGMPRELVARIETDIRDAIMDDSIYRQLVGQGFQPVGGTSAQLTELINRDLPLWRELVRKSGARAE